MSVETSANSFCYDCLDEKKNNGVFKCEGCQKKFCLKHSNEHRMMLKTELNKLIEEQKAFSKEFKEENFISTKFFDQIDRWEQKSIEQIRQTARILRKQVHEMARQQIETTKNKFEKFQNQIRKLENENEFLESDLNRWKILFEQFKCEQSILSPTINVEENPNEILIRPLSLVKSSPETLIDDVLIGHSSQIHLDDQQILAMHCGPERGPTYISGEREYRTGRHQIRFLLTKTSPEFICSFNIMSKSMTLPPIDSSYLIYGWQTNDCVQPSSLVDQNEKVRADLRLNQRLLIELTLNCDEEKVSYFNERTKQRRELFVDLSKCPLPWKLYFYLYNIGDSVRLRGHSSIT